MERVESSKPGAVTASLDLQSDRAKAALYKGISSNPNFHQPPPVTAGLIIDIKEVKIDTEEVAKQTAALSQLQLLGTMINTRV